MAVSIVSYRPPGKRRKFTYATIPLSFLDDWMIKLTKPSSILVYLYILRRTYGAPGNITERAIPPSEFRKKLGIGKTAMHGALNELQDSNLIRVTGPIGGTRIYEILPTRSPNLSSRKRTLEITQGSRKRTPGFAQTNYKER